MVFPKSKSLISQEPLLSEPLKLEEPLLLEPIKANTSSSTKLDTLTRSQIFGYSVGHFQNDLTVACWFNYVLYFMKNVIFKNDPNSGFYAGMVLLSGQLADGIATPLVGYFSDKTNTRIGKRTPWYIFGAVIVTICFLFIFQHCLLCGWLNNYTDNIDILYYCFFAAAYNVGWAAVQVSHMSLVPSLTLSRKMRDKLNNYRNTFTCIANLYVLILAFFLFLLLANDYTQFKILGLGSLGVGFLTTIVFLATVNEKKLTEDCKKIKRELRRKKLSVDSEDISPTTKMDLARNISETQSEGEQTPTIRIRSIASESDISLSETDSAVPSVTDSALPSITDIENCQPSKDENKEQTVADPNAHAEEVFNWKDWFKIPAFYLYGFVYIPCRLLVNYQNSLIIFYLESVLGISQGNSSHSDAIPIEFAIIPIIIYLSSTITSTSVKSLYQKIGRKKTFAIGAISAIIGVSTMMFLGPETSVYIYPIAIFIGLGQSISLNTAISLVGEVVGSKGSSGAFVFGIYSMLDKFSSGIALYLVMNLKDVSLPANSEYVRMCNCLVPGVAIVVAWTLISIGKAADYDSGDVVMDHSQKKPERNENLTL